MTPQTIHDILREEFDEDERWADRTPTQAAYVAWLEDAVARCRKFHPDDTWAH